MCSEDRHEISVKRTISATGERVTGDGVDGKMSRMACKVLFCIGDVAFLATGYFWMAHGNEFSGNVFKFIIWLSFALSIVVTSMKTPVKSDPFHSAWRPWMAGYGVTKVVMTAGFGQFTLAAIMTADSILLWSRVREWDRRDQSDLKSFEQGSAQNG